MRRGGLVALPSADHCRLPAGPRRSGVPHSRARQHLSGDDDTGRSSDDAGRYSLSARGTAGGSRRELGIKNLVFRADMTDELDKAAKNCPALAVPNTLSGIPSP